MSTVATIVEGDGEVEALPLLLRRLADWQTPGIYVDVPSPIRVRRDRFLNRDQEFQRHLLLAAAKCGEEGWVLIVLDADDDCPAELGSEILARAKICAPHRRISVVLANREFEAWYIAAAKSLDGRRGFSLSSCGIAVDPERIRDAKGWLRAQMVGTTYREVIDQPAFAASMDLPTAFERSRSFRKLCTEWNKQVRGQV